MKLRFYKKENRWYADIPEFIAQGGTEADCEMIAGADQWLLRLAEGKDEVTLELSKDKPLEEKIELYVTDPNNTDAGAVYTASSYKGEQIHQSMWVCPVTLFVFNEYPKTIHYSVN